MAEVIVTTNLQMRKLRHTEVKCLTQITIFISRQGRQTEQGTTSVVCMWSGNEWRAPGQSVAPRPPWAPPEPPAVEGGKEKWLEPTS